MDRNCRAIRRVAVTIHDGRISENAGRNTHFQLFDVAMGRVGSSFAETGLPQDVFFCGNGLPYIKLST